MCDIVFWRNVWRQKYDKLYVCNHIKVASSKKRLFWLRFWSTSNSFTSLKCTSIDSLRLVLRDAENRMPKLKKIFVNFVFTSAQDLKFFKNWNLLYHGPGFRNLFDFFSSIRTTIWILLWNIFSLTTGLDLTFLYAIQCSSLRTRT